MSYVAHHHHPRVAAGDDGEAIAGGNLGKHHWGTKTPLSFASALRLPTRNRAIEPKVLCLQLACLDPRRSSRAFHAQARG
jgi:hypothetical protein